jgi:hypothetical protein
MIRLKEYTMSVFYLLPPRPLLGDRLAEWLHRLFPGLDWDGGARSGLVERLAEAAAEGRTDVWIVYRDDLPGGEPPARALVDGFGAEPGDEVVEVRPDGRGDGLTARRWRIG